MKLINELQKPLGKRSRDKIVNYIGQDQHRFNKLVYEFLNGPSRITQRAAWPLSYCVCNYPDLVTPHLKTLILNLRKPELPDAVKRNTVRFLQFINIPKSLHGQLIDICYSFLTRLNEPVAIRVFSMTVLANLSKEYPDLKGELTVIIEDQMPYGSAGFVSRGKKVLKQ